MGKKLLAVAVILLSALSLPAAYITTVVGEDVYIIDERTGDILSRIRDGEIFDVGYGSDGANEYPIKTYSGRLNKYALKVDIRTKFTDENVYIHTDISTEYGAYDDVLEEFSDEGSVITVRLFDSDNFFLGEEDIDFSDAVHVWNEYDEIVRLSVDMIAESSANLLSLVDHIDFTYRIGSGVTPSDMYFATKLSVPEWLQNSYYCADDNVILHFSPTDISSEPLDGSEQWFYLSDEITNGKRDAYRYDGIEPNDYFSESFYSDSYWIFHGENLMEFYQTDNPYVVDTAYDYGFEYYPLLRTDYRASIDIPDWLVGSWSYGESGKVEVSEADIVVDGKSLVDESTNATIETYLAVGIVDPYLDTEISEDSFTIYIDEMPTTVTQTDNPLVVEVSGFMVPDNEVLKLTKTVE